MDKDKNPTGYNNTASTIRGLQAQITKAKKNKTEIIDEGQFIGVATGMSPEGHVVEVQRKLGGGLITRKEAEFAIKKGLDGNVKNVVAHGEGFLVTGVKDDIRYYIDSNFIMSEYTPEPNTYEADVKTAAGGGGGSKPFSLLDPNKKGSADVMSAYKILNSNQ
jgi:hypothetical protein